MMESIRFFLFLYDYIWEYFLFRAVTRANPGSRTTNPFETPVVVFY